MLVSFNSLKSKFKYGDIERMLREEKIYKIEKGIYSDDKNAIFTLESAFYYHNLTDVIPDKNVLAIKRGSYLKNDSTVKFVTYIDKYFEVGKTTIVVDGVEIKIYNKERMLIELIRNRKSYGFDYYKEIINNYREIRDQLDIGKLTDYINIFSNDDYLYDVIMKEVF